MITKLNLASHPFRNRTLPYLLALVILAFAVAGAVLSFAKLNGIAAKSEVAKQEIDAMSADLEEFKKKGELVQQQLSAEQRELLVAAHKLVANKTFGWSRLFADLESVLPGGVSSSRINVENVYKDGDRIKAELEFSVLSRDYQSVISMIDNMNNSGIFQAELRGQTLQKTEHFSFTEYNLHLIYSPRVFIRNAGDIAAADSAQGGAGQ